MSRKLLLPLAAAMVGALFPLIGRAAEEFKGAYEAGSASGSASSAPVSGSSGATSISSVAAAIAPAPTDPASPIATTAPSSSASSSSSAAPSGSGTGVPITGGPITKPPPKPEEDPLIIPDGIRGTIGSSYAVEDRPAGKSQRSGLWPLAYKERIGNEVTTAVFPFYYDRRLLDPAGKPIEQKSFYGLYYKERTAKHDVDFAFPLYFHWRDDDTSTTIVPPVLWRDGPSEWHRWLAPIVFASSQPDGGYFHLPPLLTFSHHNAKRAFTMIGGIGYYDRTEHDVDWGVFPFVFGGNNSDKLTSYVLIPPLLTYHAQNKDLETSTWVLGPLYTKTTPKSSVVDILPLFLHNEGEDYNATTLLPFFHVSKNKDKRLLITPLFLRAADDEGTTIVTPFYSRYRGRTQLDLAGPIVPLFMHYTDRDVFKESWLFGPVYTSHDPTGYTIFTPLFGQWREYGVSNTTWIFPTIEHETRIDGWSFDIHPLLYVGRDGADWHSVVAPIWWDFLTPKKRTTIAFPLFWRFRDEEGVTQVAGNTLYIDHSTSKGPSYDFYFLPIVHVGEQPNGSAWDVLFGFIGYKREGTYKQLKLFWIPIDLTHDPNAAPEKKPSTTKVPEGR